MKRKILVIDGGGVKGIFPASFLADIEKKIDGKIGDYFDLVVGTSTGGIIALGIGLGLPVEDILDFYKDYGPTIFGGSHWVRSIRHFFYPKYDQRSLKLALKEVFKDARLGDSTSRLVIPSLDLDTGKVYIHKTAHHDRFGTDYQRTVVDVALSIASAPTYFPPHIMPSGSPLIDGGVWANNPTGLAVVEAIGVLKWPASELQILSIGCTSAPIGNHHGWGGLAYWAVRAVDLFMHAQDSASLGTASILTSHEQIVRIDPIVSPKKYKLDGWKAAVSLQGLGSSYAREQFPLTKHFFDTKVSSFNSYYKLTK